MKSINSMNKGNHGFGMGVGLSPKDNMPTRTGQTQMIPELSYNPMVREINQAKTMSQTAAYETAKQMASQDRTDMRGNVAGFGDTLG
jgi:hypothetical protein